MFRVNANRVRELMFEREINGVTELARQARINPLTAAKIVKDGTTATAKIIHSLAKFFGVNGNELILKE